MLVQPEHRTASLSDLLTMREIVPPFRVRLRALAGLHGVQTDRLVARQSGHRPIERVAFTVTVAIGLVASVVFILLLTALSRRQEAAAQWISHTLEVLAAADDLDTRVAVVIGEGRGLIIDKSGGTSERFEAAAAQASTDVSTLKVLTADNPRQGSTLSRIERMAATRMDLLREAVAGGGTSAAATREADRLTETIFDDIGSFKADERQLLAQRREAALQASRDWLIWTLSCGVLTAGCCLTGAALLNRAREDRHISELHNLNEGLEERVRVRNTQLAINIKELEQSNKELDDFAFIASHDLKEPLRGIFNNARFLQEDYAEKLDTDGARRLARLGYLSQQMERLINDLLYFSRLGRQALATQLTDLNVIIHDIRDLNETTLVERNATIVIPHILPSIFCDKPGIAEVFRNLISNSVKYNNNLEKTVEIGCLDEMLTSDGVEARVFYVKDNGIGIAPEFHEDVFRLFKRLNPEDDDKKGTGAGLTFVRKIIQRRGGRIWLDSAFGEGTTVYFTIGQGEHRETDV